MNCIARYDDVYLTCIEVVAGMFSDEAIVVLENVDGTRITCVVPIDKLAGNKLLTKLAHRTEDYARVLIPPEYSIPLAVPYDSLSDVSDVLLPALGGHCQ